MTGSPPDDFDMDMNAYPQGWRKWVPSGRDHVPAVCWPISTGKPSRCCLPPILQDTGLSAAEYAKALGGLFLCLHGGNPLWGSLIDYVGLRVGMLLAVAIWTLASRFSRLAIWIAGFRPCAAGAGVRRRGRLSRGACARRSRHCRPRLQARGMALSYSGSSLGSIMTPFVVVPIALHFGWRSAFFATGVMGVAWLILWWVVARPPLLPPHRGQHAEIQMAQSARATCVGGDRKLWTWRRRLGRGLLSWPAIFE